MYTHTNIHTYYTRTYIHTPFVHELAFELHKLLLTPLDLHCLHPLSCV